MSVQIKDKIFFYNNNDIKGSVEILEGSNKLLKLESPQDLNNNIISSCYRGYLAKYIIINDKLILDELQINSDYDVSMIANNSIKVTQGTLNGFSSKHHNTMTSSNNSILFEDKYTNINLPINFSGKLLVGYKKNHHSLIKKNDSLKYWSNKYKNLIEIDLCNGKISKLNFLSNDELNKKIRSINYIKSSLSNKLRYSNKSIHTNNKQTSSE